MCSLRDDPKACGLAPFEVAKLEVKLAIVPTGLWIP